jgi:hypothetical protein
MYCPSCGVESAPGLSYCNRCGGSLTSLATPVISEEGLTKPIVALGTTMAVLTLGGFFLLLLGAIKLAAATRIDPEVVKPVLVLGILQFL